MQSKNLFCWLQNCCEKNKPDSYGPTFFHHHTFAKIWPIQQVVFLLTIYWNHLLCPWWPSLCHSSNQPKNVMIYVVAQALHKPLPFCVCSRQTQNVFIKSLFALLPSFMQMPTMCYCKVFIKIAHPTRTYVDDDSHKFVQTSCREKKVYGAW